MSAAGDYPKLFDDPLIQRTIERANVPPEYFEGHLGGCSFGGMSCLWWLKEEGCPKEHPNVHVHAPGERCPLVS